MSPCMFTKHDSTFEYKYMNKTLKSLMITWGHETFVVLGHLPCTQGFG